MNTMKKEDLVKERADLVVGLAQCTASFLSPIVSIFNMVSRLSYVESEIRKVTPVPTKPELVKEPEDVEPI